MVKSGRPAKMPSGKLNFGFPFIRYWFLNHGPSRTPQGYLSLSYCVIARRGVLATTKQSFKRLLLRQKSVADRNDKKLKITFSKLPIARRDSGIFCYGSRQFHILKEFFHGIDTASKGSSHGILEGFCRPCTFRETG